MWPSCLRRVYARIPPVLFSIRNCPTFMSRTRVGLWGPEVIAYNPYLMHLNFLSRSHWHCRRGVLLGGGGRSTEEFAPVPNEKAPDHFKVRLDTTKGPVLIQVEREWAPIGADRFYTLVKTSTPTATASSGWCRTSSSSSD